MNYLERKMNLISSVRFMLAFGLSLFMHLHDAKAATFYKVSDLLADCVSGFDSDRFSYCLGVMDGAADVLMAMKSPSGVEKEGTIFPLPSGYTDPRQAIIALDREISRLSGNPYARDTIAALEDYRNHIAASIEKSRHHVNSPLMACFGSSTPVPGDLAQAFVRWAKAHPDDLDAHQSVGVLKAFSAAWPCR